jgi:hypothetical protein
MVRFVNSHLPAGCTHVADAFAAACRNAQGARFKSARCSLAIAQDRAHAALSSLWEEDAMVVLQARSLLWLAALGALSLAGNGRAAESDAHGLLVLQATSRMAVDLAENNRCAAIELQPRIDAALRYLSAAPAGGEPVVGETIEILAATNYDTVPCDTPCPPMTTAAAEQLDELRGPEATARHTASLNEVVTRWLKQAESDPPRLSIAVARYSHDPLPRYLPGQPVDYLVHVGASCHGAVLALDRDYELPALFDGSGSFVPPRDGLWSIHVRRRDGLTLSPLTYLDANTGLPSYYKEFWVGTEAVKNLGPGGLGPWAK